MTVETTSTLAGPYPLNGIATAFPFGFKAMSPAEVRVEVDRQIVDQAQFTVQLGSQGGTVIFSTAPVGVLLYVISDPDFRQGISFSNQSAFLPASHNEANDRAAVRDQVLAEGLVRAVQVPLGEQALVLPEASERAGGALIFDASGSPAVMPLGSFPAGPPGPANNTYTSYAALQASDPTRKYAYLAGDTDASPRPNGPYVNTTGQTGAWVPQPAAGVGYGPRTVASKLADTVSPDDRAEANDTLRLNAALSAQSAEAVRGTVEAPSRTMALASPGQLPKFGHLRGRGVGSILTGASGQPVLQNATSDALIFSVVENMTLRGGTRAIDVNVTAEIASLKFVDVAAELWTDTGLRFNSGLTSSKFIRPYINGISGTGPGILAAGGQNNNNLFAHGDILNCSGPAISLRNASTQTLVDNMRIEGNGKAGVGQFFLENPYGFHIRDLYTEASHEFLIVASGAADDSICVEGMVNIGSNYTGSNGFVGSKWSVGNSRIVLGWNLYLQPTSAPPVGFVYAPNRGLLCDGSLIYTRDVAGSQHSIGRKRTFAAVADQTFTYFTATRPTTTNTGSNRQVLSHTSRVLFTGYDGGGVDRWAEWEVRIGINAKGSTVDDPNSSASVTLIQGNIGSITLAAQKAADPTTNQAVLQLVFSGVNTSLPNSVKPFDQTVRNLSLVESDAWKVVYA